MRKATVAVLSVAVVMAAAGCSSKHQTGNSSLLNFPTTKQAGLGASPTTTPAALVTTTPAGPRPTSAPKTTTAATTAPRSVTTAAPAAVHYAIAINPDGNPAGQFAPADVEVPRGTVVTWTNDDTQPRSVVATGGAFNSGLIAPGHAWSYTASTAGTFSYKDGTRPYALATLQVA